MKSELLELLPEMVVFVAVGKAKSFSRAARALGMPVSTVSRRVSEIEGRLGLQLLSRTTRQVELTDAGLTYFERCQSILEAAEAARSELEGHTQNPRGQLRISATEDFALTFLTPLFEELTRRHPELSFELDLTPRSVDLVAESFDVAIRMGRLADSQLVVRRLGASRRGVYASPSYLARAGEPRAPRDLAKHECIRVLVPSDAEVSTWTLFQGEASIDVVVQGRHVANSIRFLVQLAARGLGVVAVDAAVAQPEVEAGRLARVLPDWSPAPVPVHALTPGRLLPAKTKVFLDCLTEHLAGLERSGEAALPKGAAARRPPRRGR